MTERRDKKRTSGKKNQWVIRHHDGWAVKGEGNRRVTRITNTQQEAIQIANRIARAQGSEVIVQDRSGKIRSRDSYGNEPNPPGSAFSISLERSLDENQDVWRELSKH